MMKKILTGLVCCLIAGFAIAQTPDNSATVYISKLKMRWGLSPLPIQLVDFRGDLEGSKVVLTWQTAMESSNSHFEVLRSSSENPDPVKIAEVSGYGNTTRFTNYSYTDKQALLGTNYYQLKQVDFDGKSSLSNIIAIHTDLAGSVTFNIYQTLSGIYAANIFLENDTDISVNLSDINGRILNTVKSFLTKGENQIDIYTRQLTPGIYIAHLLLNNKQISTKVLIH